MLMASHYQGVMTKCHLDVNAQKADETTKWRDTGNLWSTNSKGDISY